MIEAMKEHLAECEETDGAPLFHLFEATWQALTPDGAVVADYQFQSVLPVPRQTLTCAACGETVWEIYD